MTRQAALTKLAKVLGPKAYAEVSERPTSPEQRAAYAARRSASRTAEQAAAAALAARRKAVLEADPEWRALAAAWQQAHREVDDVRYRDGESGWKVEVGTVSGIFRTPLAKGDTWEEVFAALATRPEK